MSFGSALQTGRLDHLALSFIFVSLSAEAIGALRTYMLTKITCRLAARLRAAAFTHLLGFSFRFFANSPLGSLSSRMTTDISGAAELIDSSMVTLLVSLATFGFATLAMLQMNWHLAVGIVCAVPLLVYPTSRVGKRMYQEIDASQSATMNMSGLLAQSFSGSGALLWRTFDRQEYERARFELANQAVLITSVRSRLAGTGFFALLGALVGILPGIIYWSGGYAVMHTGMTVGEVVAFSVLTLRLFQPVLQLLKLSGEATEGFVHAKRVQQLISSVPDASDEVDALEPTSNASVLEFREVSFRYSPEEREVLANISFTLQPGGFTALVGRSGAGKSTVASLAIRLFDVERGAVFINGIDSRILSRRWIAKQIAIVTQDIYLFDDTIRENLRYANPIASDQDLERAARDAEIHDVILALPEGYDTLVGVRGWRLSGGEKQRIAIARAILRDAPILILDEATSSLDSKGDQNIRSALYRLMENRTTLLISHKLSNVRDAKEILLMENGTIRHRGSHEQLLRDDNGYRSLVGLVDHC